MILKYQIVEHKQNFHLLRTLHEVLSNIEIKGVKKNLMNKSVT